MLIADADGGRSRLRPRRAALGMLVLWAATLSPEAAALPGVIVAWGDNARGQTNVPPGLTNVVAVGGSFSFAVALNGDGTVTNWGGAGIVFLAPPAGLSNVVSIAAGVSLVAALKSDGTVTAWGSGASSTNVPAGLQDAAFVAAGYDHGLAVRSNGTVVAWGNNDYGQCNIPTGLSNVIAVAGGRYHSLALKADGTVAAWGKTDFNVLDVPANLTNAVKISAFAFNNAALKRDGTVATWGYNYTAVPAGLSNVVDIGVGYYHVLALKNDGAITGWGYNSQGQLDGLGGLSNVTAVAGGGEFSLALTRAPVLRGPLADQTAVAGTNVVLNFQPDSSLPLSFQWQLAGTNLTGATQSSLSIVNAGLADSGVYSVVASNAYGTVASSATLTVLPALFIAPPGSRVVVEGTPVMLSPAVATTQPLSYQWLLNGAPIPGATEVALNLSPARTNDAGIYVLVASNVFGVVTSPAGFLTVFAQSQVGLVADWGSRSNWMRLGYDLLTDIVAVAAETLDRYALTGDGRVLVWGNSSPWLLTGLTNIMAVAASDYYGMFLRNDGTVDTARLPYQPPPGLTNVTAIAAGWRHYLALRRDGTVAAWGYGDYGQTSVPADLTNAMAIAAGTYHSVALRSDGKVVCWGSNSDGQTAVPPGLDHVAGVAAGTRTTFAIKEDGSVVGWGSAGLTNAPAAATNVVQLAVGNGWCWALRRDGTLVGWGTWAPNGELSPPSWLSAVASITRSEADVVVVTRGPVVVAGPTNLTVVGGTNATFTVQAISQTPLRYQWQFNGVDIDSATNSSLTLSGVQYAQAGTYSVAMRNDDPQALGSVSATLTVVPAIIQAQPSNQMVWAGGRASFAPLVTSAVPLSYQWLFNGTNLAGATGAALVLTNVQPADIGSYSVIISNSFGALTSIVRMLRIVPCRPPATALAWGNNTYGQMPVPVGLVTNVVDIAAGAFHTLVLLDNGRLRAWGDDQYGQTSLPYYLTNAVAIAAGSYDNVVLKADGTVVQCDSYQETNLLPGVDDAVAIAFTGGPLVVLRQDGRVTNLWDTAAMPAGLTNVVAVAAGLMHTLALRNDGQVIAWGDNGSGQTNVPAGLSNVVAIAARSYRSFAVKADGTVVGWGSTNNAGLAIPATATNVAEVFPGSYYNFARTGDGSLIGWGSDPTLNVPAPYAQSPGFTQVAFGVWHAAALTRSPIITAQPQPQLAPQGGTATFSAAATGFGPFSYQWQFGAQNLDGATNATLVLGNVQPVNAGSYSVIVSNAYGRVRSTNALLSVVPWRLLAPPMNQPGLAGTSVVFSISALIADPVSYQWYRDGVAVAGANASSLVFSNVQPLDAGFYTVTVSNPYVAYTSGPVSLTAPGNLGVWSSNVVGRLWPVGLSNAVGFAAGGRHVVALRSDGTVTAWGTNDYRQLSLPAGLTNVIAVAAGSSHSLALKRTGTVVAWGDNRFLQTNIPTGLSNVVAIAAGSAHSLALRRDGSMVRWGDYNAGTPSASNAVAIAAGGVHNLALLLDGTVASWGSSSYSLSPPAGLSNVVAVACGDNHSVALRSDSSVSAWGKAAALPPASLSNVVQIAAGGDQTYAVFRDGSIQGWGAVGPAPGVPSGLRDVISVSAGAGFAVALTRSPCVMLQPTNVSTPAGNTIQLSPGISGIAPLRWQWRKDGFDLPGATNGSLTLANVSRAAGGSYVVLASNVFGTATSAEARVHVLVPQRLAVSGAPGGTVLISSQDSDGGVVTSADLAFFQAWGSTNLVTWEALTNSITLTNGALVLTDTAVNVYPRRFYRIIEQP